MGDFFITEERNLIVCLPKHDRLLAHREVDQVLRGVGDRGRCKAHAVQPEVSNLLFCGALHAVLPKWVPTMQCQVVLGFAESISFLMLAAKSFTQGKTESEMGT